jgi:hypothetical protein
MTKRSRAYEAVRLMSSVEHPGSGREKSSPIRLTFSLSTKRARCLRRTFSHVLAPAELSSYSATRNDWNSRKRGAIPKGRASRLWRTFWMDAARSVKSRAFSSRRRGGFIRQSAALPRKCFMKEDWLLFAA